MNKAQLSVNTHSSVKNYALINLGCDLTLHNRITFHYNSFALHTTDNGLLRVSFFTAMKLITKKEDVKILILL
jgi:hypothetical protein